MHSFCSFNLSHMLTVECVFMSLCLAQTVTKMRSKCKFLFIPEQECQIRPQENWRKLEKIAGCCSNVLYHSIYSDYADYPHSIDHSHFISVCVQSYATLWMMCLGQVSLGFVQYIQQCPYFPCILLMLMHYFESWKSESSRFVESSHPLWM